MTMRALQWGALATTLSLLAWSTPLWSQDSVTATMSISATLHTACSVSADPLNFGTLSETTPTDSQADFRVQCSAGSSYTIGLGAGLYWQNNPPTRRMRHATNNSHVPYTLYKDAERTNPVGAAGPDNFLGPTASDGELVTYTVYATANTASLPGQYSDSILVRVTY